MACYSPIKAYRPLSLKDGGRLVFNPAKARNRDNPISLPCNNCIGCRIARSQEWATRLMHESQMHEKNCFITLTFNDEHLPENYSVSKRDTQLFMKRLRKHLEPSKVRFFAVGEYGDLNLRPHYHLIIFGHDWPDKQLHTRCPDTGVQLWTSAELATLWSFGFSTSGDVNYKTAAYCARYVLKKINGDRAPDHYTRFHPFNNTLHLVEPEYITMSTVPGLGETWFHKYKSDVFPSDFLVVDGRQTRVPRFYDKLLQKEETLSHPDQQAHRLFDTPHKRIKAARVSNAATRKEDNTPARLRVREFVKTETLKQLKRKL